MALSHHHRRLSPFKHNLLSKEQGIEQITGVLSLWSRNRVDSVSLNLSDVRTLFVPNLNIKELTIVQDERRVDSLKRHDNIVDL